MPNWCYNTVNVTSEKPADLDAVMRLLGNTDEPFMAIMPRPESVDWYDWNNAHWGCKWDADNFSISRHGDSIIMTFDTAWAPSIGVTAALADKFPSLEISHSYEEPGMAFTGCAKFSGGTKYFDEERDMESCDSSENEDGEENPDFIPLDERF